MNMDFDSIIGAGIIGTYIALEPSHHGKRVLVIDK